MLTVGHHKLRRSLGKCLNKVSDIVDRAGHQAFLHDQYSKSSGTNEAQEGQDRDVGVEIVWMKVIIEVLRVLRVLRERMEKKKS